MSCEIYSNSLSRIAMKAQLKENGIELNCCNKDFFVVD